MNWERGTWFEWDMICVYEYVDVIDAGGTMKIYPQTRS